MATTDAAVRTARTVREWAAGGPRQQVLLLRGDRGAGRSTVLREALSGLPGVVFVDCAGRSVDAVAESVLRALGTDPADARPRGTFRELVRRAAPAAGLVLLDAHLAGEYRGSAAPQAVLDHVVRHLVDRGGPVAWAAVEADAALRVTRPSSTAVVELPPPADRPAARTTRGPPAASTRGTFRS
ncbi:AAA family ATPase [Kitasatospora sp. KL5]|uniref:AAA family ATPase n=1 Tax=Kitasatospora sp. KL5 TaxID=3425125 RepID=UPI003D6DEFC9